jgi:hypothetical protein
MKTKTADLIGPALDWAVAKCEGLPRAYLIGEDFKDAHAATGKQYNKVHWSTDWSQGGPIIEREAITVTHTGDAMKWAAHVWMESSMDFTRSMYGPTPLIAAMRCYVASKLSDTVDVPEELCSPSS